VGSMEDGIRDPLSPRYTVVERNLGTREVRRNLTLMRQYREQRSYIPKDMRRRAGWATHERPFVAWDGEGYTDDTGAHHYMLFGCSTGQRIKGPSLGTVECFELLLRTEAENPDVFHVIFSGNYDVNMMLRDVDDRTLRRLKVTGVAHWLGYRMEYIKGKWFRLTAGGLTVKLYDVFTFFQAKFTVALSDWLGGVINEPGFSNVVDGKDKRADFTYTDLPYVEKYWEDELRFLVLLCERLRSLLSKAGLRISQWHGPGAIASATLRERKFVRTDTPRHINDAAAYAFSGGRFEAYKIGVHYGEVYQYDIRSAYPAAIATLPSLASEWHYKQFSNPRVAAENLYDFALYRIAMPTVLRSDWSHIGPFAWRHKSGAVFYPGWMGSTWVWGIELKAALRTEWASLIEVYEGYELEDTGERPFIWIADMYEKRAEWKAVKEAAERALKLAMNSIYGKLAQQVGCRYDPQNGWTLPRYHQLEYAGYILASCRARLYSALMESPSSVIAVETDAVISTTPLTLMEGTGLGQWEASSFSAIAYLQSGLYFARTHDGEWKTRTRGFGRSGTSAPLVLEYLDSIRDYESGSRPLVINERRFRTIGTHIGKRDWRRWVDDPRAITVGMPGGKREHLPEACQTCQAGLKSYGAGLHDTVPALSASYDVGSVLDYRIPSVPYPLKWRGDPPPEYIDAEWWQSEEWDVRWDEVYE